MGKISETEQPVLCEITDGIAEITLNRPEQTNTHTSQMGDELNAALRRFHEDDSVRAIIVTGAGRSYCAGADLGKGGATFSPKGREEEIAERRATRIEPWEVSKPIIAAEDMEIAMRETNWARGVSRQSRRQFGE